MSTKTQTVDVNDDYFMDRDALQDEVKRGPSYWRPKEGKNLIRILFLKGRGRWFLRASQHFNVGPDNKSCFCPQEMEQKSCVVCNEVRELRRSPDPDDKSLAKLMRAKEQFFVAMVDMAATSTGVQIYGFGSMIMDQLMMVQRDPDWGHPFHPTEGRNFSIDKVQTGPEKFNVKYTVFPSAKISAIENMEWESDAIEAIDDVIKFVPQDQVRAWLLGVKEEDDDEEEEENEKPRFLKRETLPQRAKQEEVDPDYAEEPIATPTRRPITKPVTTPSGKIPGSAAERLRNSLSSINKKNS